MSEPGGSFYRELKIFKFRVIESQNPPTINNVSAYTTVLHAFISLHPEIIPKEILSARRLAEKNVVLDKAYISITRQNFGYSSFGVRGRENYIAAESKHNEHQRHKDGDPQKRVMLMLRKPISHFSKFLSRGQTQVLNDKSASKLLVGQGCIHTKRHDATPTMPVQCGRQARCSDKRAPSTPSEPVRAILKAVPREGERDFVLILWPLDGPSPRAIHNSK